MRVTIVKDDHIVIIDGEGYGVDCSKLPETFHALQWDGQRGEVEHRAMTCAHCNVRSKKGNEIITDLEPYQPYVDAWRLAKTQHDQEKAAQDNAA